VILTSVRARLAFWHTVVLAVLLTLFVWAAYAFVLRTSRVRTDAAVLDAVGHLRTALISERRHQPTATDAAREVLAGLHFQKIAFVIFDSAGRSVAVSLTRPELESDEEPAPSLDTARLAQDARASGTETPHVVDLPDREGGYRAALAPANLPDGRFVVAAAVSLSDEEETLADARHALFMAVPVALLLAGLSGWLLARRSLQPMVVLRERTARIGATNLSERVPIANATDEVGQLASVINDLLGRLEQAFAQQRQFMADASHELRTPVAACA
jgi:methyl-accepting chemotaxis protein